MKWGIATILVLCLVHVQPKKLEIFTPGNEYTYRYKAQALSNIPDVDASQLSGIALKGIVRIQAMPNGIAIIKFEHLKRAKINAELRTVDMDKIPYRYEDLISPSGLLSPMKVKFSRGLITQFETDANEPEYATNVKRALLEMLQVHLSPYYLPGTGRSDSSAAKSYDYDSKQEYARHSSPYENAVVDDTVVYDVMEDGLAGVCETSYIVESNPWAGNPDQDVMNVTKTRNFDECLDETEWAVSSHPTNNCTNCDAEEEDPVDSIKIIEYDIRVDSDKVVIENIYSRSETVYAPLTTNADEIHTNHTKELSLISVHPISNPLPRPMSPKAYDSLKYDFPELEEGKEPSAEELQGRPASFLPLDGKQYPEVARNLIREISKEIEENAQVPIVSTPYKVFQLGRALRTLSAQPLSQILKESAIIETRSEYGGSYGSDSAKTKRQVTVDGLLLCGSLPCYATLLRQILSHEIQEAEAIHIITRMPLNILRPTSYIIEKLQRVCESESVKRGTQMQKSCWLAFASMVDQSCGSNTTTVPVSPGLDSYCSDEQELKYVQAIGKQLRKAEKTEQRLLFVHALEVTGSDEMIQVLRPIVRGEYPVHEMVRTKAVFALRRAAIESPQEVASLIAPIFYDVEETTEMRAAALITLIKSSPKPHLLERIASVTWNEDDNQLVGLIATILDNYGNTTHPCYTNKAAHAGHAQAMLTDDIEDDDVGIQDSQVYITDSVDDDYNIASILKVYSVANNKTVIPRVLIVKIERLLATFSQTPLKIMVQSQGIGSVFNRIFGPKSAFSKLSLQEIFRSSYEGEVPKNYRDLFNKLKISPRVDDPLKIALYTQLQTSIQSMYYLDAQKVLSMIESGASWPKIQQLFGSGLRINNQMIFNYGFVRYQLPSSLGLPIVVRFESPAILKIKGKISINIEETYGISNMRVPIPKKISIHVDLKPTLSINLITMMGVACPISKTYSAAGVISKLYVTAPIETTVQLDVAETKVTTLVKYSKQQPQTTSAQKMIFYYKVKPFTALFNYASFDSQLTMLKPITTKNKLDEYEIPIGKHILGIGSVLKVKSDQYWQDQGSFYTWLTEENDLLSLATSFWATPDFKLREYILLVDAEAAKKAELSMTVDVDYLPSKIQALISRGRTSPRGALSLFLGWAKIPWQCTAYKGDTSSQFQHYQEAGSRRRSSSDYYDDTYAKKRYPNDDDDDDDDDDDEISSSYSSKKRVYKRSIYQNRSRGIYDDEEYEAQRRQQKYSSDVSQTYDNDNDDDDDDDDDEEIPWIPSGPSTDPSQGTSGLHTIPINKDTATNVVKVKVDMAIRGPMVSRSLKSVLQLIRNKADNVDSWKLDVSIRNPPFTPSNSLEICAAGSMKYPVLPCDYANGLNPDTVQPIITKAAISFGQTCSNQKQIEIQATFSKTKDQKEYEREGKAWFFQQCSKDYREGKKMSSACMEAIEAVGELKKMELDIHYRDIPDYLYNLTYKVENFINYNYYKYMTRNPVNINNGEGHLKIKTYFDESDPIIDIKVLKPHSNTYYENIYTDEISQYLQPINARVGFWRSTLDEATGGYAPPTCKLMGSYIESFDNETYKIPISTCKQVLTKDCSANDLFSILAKKSSTGYGKVLEVHLLHHKIEARPAGPQHSGQFEVTVDGQKQIMQPNTVKLVNAMGVGGEQKVIAAIILIGDLLHIRAPYHAFWIKFDGENIKIEASNIHRGHLCGVCSEFDGSTDQTFVGPGQCEYAEAKDFAYSYTVRDSQCSAPPPSDRKICPGTVSQYPSVGYRQQAQRRSSYDQADYDDIDEDKSSSNIVLRNKIETIRGKLCYSTYSVPECRDGYYATKTKSQLLTFACPTEGAPMYKQLKADRSSRQLHEIASHKIDFTEMVDVPEQCRRS